MGYWFPVAVVISVIFNLLWLPLNLIIGGLSELVDEDKVFERPNDRGVGLDNPGVPSTDNDS